MTSLFFPTEVNLGNLFFLKFTGLTCKTILYIFQADESMIGYLHAEMTRLLRKFLGKFVSTAVIRGQSDITKVDFMDPENQLTDQYLAVGMKARTYLADNDDLPAEKISSFFE